MWPKIQSILGHYLSFCLMSYYLVVIGIRGIGKEVNFMQELQKVEGLSVDELDASILIIHLHVQRRGVEGHQVH